MTEHFAERHCTFRVEICQVERSQFLAVPKHTPHMDYFLCIETRNVEGGQTDASVEHIIHKTNFGRVDKSSDFRLLQPRNIFAIQVTLVVLKLDRLSEVRF